MNYYCPICGNNINDLVNSNNLGSDKILFCPHCSVGLELNYDEHHDYSFELAKKGD